MVITPPPSKSDPFGIVWGLSANLCSVQEHQGQCCTTGRANPEAMPGSSWQQPTAVSHAWCAVHSLFPGPGAAQVAGAHWGARGPSSPVQLALSQGVSGLCPHGCQQVAGHHSSHLSVAKCGLTQGLRSTQPSNLCWAHRSSGTVNSGCDPGSTHHGLGMRCGLGNQKIKILFREF